MKGHIEDILVGGRPMTKNEIKIKELQKELELSNSLLLDSDERVDELQDRIELNYKQIDQLQHRIDKAIEYIEEYQEVLKEHNGDWLNYQDGFKPYLLQILKGSEKE